LYGYDLKRRTGAKDIREHTGEKSVWTEERGSNRLLEYTA
jgi:hypothetical protein